MKKIIHGIGITVTCAVVIPYLLITKRRMSRKLLGESLERIGGRMKNYAEQKRAAMEQNRAKIK